MNNKRFHEIFHLFFTCTLYGHCSLSVNHKKLGSVTTLQSVSPNRTDESDTPGVLGSRRLANEQKRRGGVGLLRHKNLVRDSMSFLKTFTNH